MNKKKQNTIIIFYILYFTWIFTVTYLTPDISLLNIFTITVLLFYFVFLRERGDIFWLVISTAFGFASLMVTISGWQIDLNLETVKYIPVWLPLSWGITVLALRKFYNILNVGIR